MPEKNVKGKVDNEDLSFQLDFQGVEMLKKFFVVFISIISSASIFGDELKFKGEMNLPKKTLNVNGVFQCSEDAGLLNGFYQYENSKKSIKITGRSLENGTFIGAEGNPTSASFIVGWDSGNLTGYWTTLKDFYPVVLSPEKVFLFSGTVKRDESKKYSVYSKPSSYDRSSILVDVGELFTVKITEDSWCSEGKRDRFLGHVWVELNPWTNNYDITWSIDSTFQAPEVRCVKSYMKDGYQVEPMNTVCDDTFGNLDIYPRLNP